RYLRLHAKFLNAIDLKQAWSMVTATLAGLLLNWSAPLFLVVIAALAAIFFKKTVPAAPWPIILAISGVLTGLALLRYGWLMRKGRGRTQAGGRLFAMLVAVTGALGLLWLLDTTYSFLPALLDAISHHWTLSGIVAALVAAGPAIIRFVPVLKTPAVRM